MGNAKCRAVGEGISIVNGRWGREFTGTDDELVRAGLISADWLPGRPGMGTTRQTVILNDDGSGEPVRVQGGGLKRKAAGRRSLAIIRISYRRCKIERDYWPGEEAIQADAESARKAAETWTPMATTPYGIELEVCRPEPKGMDFFLSRSRSTFKYEFESASRDAFMEALSDESGKPLDVPIYMFTVTKYMEIMIRLRGGGGGGGGGGDGNTPTPTPSPALTA